MAQKKSFLIYHDWDTIIALFNTEEKARLWDNMFRRVKGEDPILMTPMEVMFWTIYIQAQERNEIEYERICERNRENGKKGGAPIGNNNAAGENNPKKAAERIKQPTSFVTNLPAEQLQRKQPKQPDKDNDKDNGNDNDNGNDKDKEKDTGIDNGNRGPDNNSIAGPEENFKLSFSKTDPNE